MQIVYLRVDEIKIDIPGQRIFPYLLFLAGFLDAPPFLYPLTVYDSKPSSSPRLVAGRHEMVKAY